MACRDRHPHPDVRRYRPVLCEHDADTVTSQLSRNI